MEKKRISGEELPGPKKYENESVYQRSTESKPEAEFTGEQPHVDQDSDEDAAREQSPRRGQD